MRKKILFVIVGLLIVFDVSIAYMIKKSNESKIYTGIATVVQSPSFKKSIVEISDNQNNIVGKADIYSNVFLEGEQLNVEYSKKGKKYSITKIESTVDTRAEKAKLITHIRSDVTMRSYRHMIKVSTDVNQPNTEIPALPEKIVDQYYSKTISPNDFFAIVRDIYSAVPLVYPNAEVSVKFDETASFKILSLEKIYIDGTKEEVSYTLNGQILKFKNIAEIGEIYSLRTEFENGDIINYIFWMEDIHY